MNESFASFPFSFNIDFFVPATFGTVTFYADADWANEEPVDLLGKYSPVLYLHPSDDYPLREIDSIFSLNTKPS